MRRIALGLGVVLVLIAGLALAGAGYEAIAARGDAQAYPAPGQLVDVGGYSLHIQCVGTGNPTVVLDAGLGGAGLSPGPAPGGTAGPGRTRSGGRRDEPTAVVQQRTGRADDPGTDVGERDPLCEIGSCERSGLSHFASAFRAAEGVMTSWRT